MNTHSPKPKQKPSRTSSDKRERILEAAIRVFAQGGFYATRVSDIAREAGVADGTIYLYFENKDDVLISIFQDRIGKLVEVLRQVAERDEPVEARVRRIIELQLGLLEGRRDLAEVITVNLRQSSKLLKQYAAPLFTEYLELIASVIAEGQKSGAFRTDVSPRVAARALWGGLDGLALTWALGGDTAEGVSGAALKKAAHQWGELFLDGLRGGIRRESGSPDRSAGK